PLTIRISGADGTASAEDVAIGDVWLCSGQSNMEYPLPRAMGYEASTADKDPDLRLMKVSHQLADTPKAGFAQPPAWQVADPSVQDLSAACYFMVHELRASEKVPIGAIDDSWGGTPIRQWMSEEAMRASGGGAMVDEIELHR